MALSRWQTLLLALLILAAAIVLDRKYRLQGPSVSQLAQDAHRTHNERSILWMAPFFSGGGYSSEAISYVVSLVSSSSSARRQIAIAQHGDGFDQEFFEGLPVLEQATLSTLARQGAALLRRPALPPNTVVICHSEPGAWHPAMYSTTRCPPAGATFTIGRTMFETDRIPSGWGDRCNKFDRIWVPGRFHMQTFLAGGVDRNKLRDIPEAVDTHFYDPDRVAPLQLPPPLSSSSSLEHANSTYRFLSVFKWEERKAWRVLLRAYFEEFKPHEPVVLYILTSPYHDATPIELVIDSWLREQGLPLRVELPPIVLLSRLPGADMPALYKAADALVIPSRGEGWGRPHCEAMAMRLPVIATNWSGNTEFMSDDNSYPLPIDGLVTLETGPFKGHRWAEPSLTHLRRLMRHVFTHPEEGRAKGRAARHTMVERYSSERVAKLIDEELASIP